MIPTPECVEITDRDGIVIRDQRIELDDLSERAKTSGMADRNCKPRFPHRRYQVF
jgi:hypothetical protein